MSKIDLSVAIIFKNEIRCLERCLKSLQPLRERLSVQIVMADTGSTDGSRAIAERYADILFDFPWINDFAAARNAVLERCRGKWILTIDCDEWLETEISGLTSFLGNPQSEKYDSAMVVVRNFLSKSKEDSSDFLAHRLFRRACGPHYQGAVHEYICFDSPAGGRADIFPQLVLNHDGYVMLNDGSEAGKLKRIRNRTILQREMEKDPNNLRLILQYLESSERTNEDYYATLTDAILLTEKRKEGWDELGPVVFREAVFAAFNDNRSELYEWIKKAQNMFSASYYTKIDVAFIEFILSLKNEKYKDEIEIGESFLEAYHLFPNDPKGKKDISRSSLQRNSPYWAQYVRLRVAEAYERTGDNARALTLLQQTDWTLLDARHTTYFVDVICEMASGGVDVGPLLSACWAGIQQPVPSPERARERVEAFQKLVSVEPVEKTQGESDELAQLAAKVKAILDKLPPDDPIAVELKSSDAYRKVAHLIEG